MKSLFFISRFFAFYILAMSIFLPGFTQELSKGQKKAILWGNQSEYHSMSQEDGPYLILNFGMRRDGKSIIPNDEFANLSGNYGLGLGNRKGNFSYEYGLNFFYHSPEILHYISEIDRSIYLKPYANSLIIPLVFRYDIPVGYKEKFRFGADFTTNYTLAALSDGLEIGYGGQGGDFSNTKMVKYTWEEGFQKSRFFFKAGLHAELQFFNSAFLIFQASRAFTISQNRSFLFTWQSEGQLGSFELESRIQGYMFELGFKIPLNVLGKKLFGKE